MPPAGTTPERLRFAFASCQKYEMGYYTAYEHMAREDLDLVVHLGDYIYEKGDGKGAVRPHGTKEIFTLDDYRARYALYKSRSRACRPRTRWRRGSSRGTTTR
jgi:alkaline phosphatase D